MPTSAIELDQVSKIYPSGIKALENIDLRIQPGEFVSLLGPSGCGKSSLLRLIAGLENPSSGHLKSEGTLPHKHRAPVAFVFQDAHLLPWRNVFDNVALPLELMKIPLSQRLSLAEKALEGVGLLEFKEAFPNQLSGGMRMRVSLARALVTQPELLLLDEPFGALDEITRQHLDEELRLLWQRLRCTVIFVTHSLTEALFLSDRILLFSKRPGRIIADERPPLPAERSRGLKTTVEFVRELQKLQDRLEKDQ